MKSGSQSGLNTLQFKNSQSFYSSGHYNLNESHNKRYINNDEYDRYPQKKALSHNKEYILNN